MGAAAPLIGGMFNAAGDMMDAQDKSWQLEDESVAMKKNAAQTREAGQFNAMKHEIEAGLKMGEIRAGYGASGVSQDSGSVLDVLRHSSTMAELDRQSIVRQSELQAQNYEERSRAAHEGSKRTKRAGEMNAFASLFAGGLKAGGNS